MIRSTSAATFRRIKEDGLLSKRRLQVYEALYEFGPCTGSELYRQMALRSAVSNSNVVTRLGELRDCGAAYEVRERKCQVSGQMVIEWDVTEKVPTELPKKKSKTEVRNRLAELVEEIYIHMGANKPQKPHWIQWQERARLALIEHRKLKGSRKEVEQ